jgi:hypothetical protein
MVRQALDEVPKSAEGLSRTTILLLAGFMAGMTAGVPSPYNVFCVAVASLSIVAYLALELTALQRTQELRPQQDGQEDGEAAPEGTSRREQRRALRYSVPAEQQEATLKVGQVKVPVRLVNISSGGFGVWAERDPGVEAGQVVWIRTDAGWDEVRVVEALPETEGFRVRLQICSAVKPWSHIRDEQRRQRWSRQSRLLAGLPLVGGVAAAVLIVLAPFVYNALLNRGDGQGRVATQRVAQSGAERPNPSDQQNHTLVQQDGTPVGAPGASDGEQGTDDAGLPESNAEAVADLARPAHGENPAAAGGDGQDGSLPPSYGNGESEDASSLVRLKLTDAINSVLRDLSEQSEMQPLMVQRLQGEEVLVPELPESSAADGSSRHTSVGPGRDRAAALASFDRGLQSFWRSEHAEALVAFGEAIERWPDDPSFHYFLALSHYLAGDREQAERTLAIAVELEAQHPVPDLGRLLERVQGPHRRWMQAARIEAKVGPYRPRR